MEKSVLAFLECVKFPYLGFFLYFGGKVRYNGVQ